MRICIAVGVDGLACGHTGRRQKNMYAYVILLNVFNGLGSFSGEADTMGHK